MDIVGTITVLVEHEHPIWAGLALPKQWMTFDPRHIGTCRWIVRMMPDYVDASVRGARLGVTRRQLGMLIGGAALAACATTPPPRQLALRRPDGVIALPSPGPSTTLPLSVALAQRQSVREFTGATISVAQISELFWAAQGVTRSSGGRTSPSAGALYPLDVYAVTRGTLWHYLPDGHRAEQWVAPGTLAAELREAALGQAAVGTAPLLVVVTGTTRRSSGKYGARAARYVTLEAGHCAQNVLLQATALGLGAVPIGAFSDDAVRHRLGLPDERTPYYLIPIGSPKGGAA